MAPRKNKAKKEISKVVLDPKQYHFLPLDFTLITTNAPKVFRSHFYPDFHAIFATKQYLYALFNYYEAPPYRLARFCKITHTWKLLPLELPRIYEFNFATLLWDQTTVLIFAYNTLIAFNLQTLEHEIIETSSMHQTIDQVVNVLQSESVEWKCMAVDKENRCIYAQCRLKFGENEGNWVIYRLQWDTKQWTKLDLVAQEDSDSDSDSDEEEEEDQLLPPGKFLAVWEGQLYMGIQDFDSRPNLFYKNMRVYNNVARIDLTTLRWATHRITQFRRNRRTLRYAIHLRIKWVQVGATMYCVGSQQMEDRSVKNDFWAIDLPSLKWICHQELTDLKQGMKSCVVCHSDEGLWVLKKKNCSEETLLVVYQIPISLPKLQLLARNAFFYRPPTGLVYPLRIKTRQKVKKPVDKQNLTAQKIKDFLREQKYHSEPFKFPDDNTI